MTKEATQLVARTARQVEEGAKRIVPVRQANENGRSGGALREDIGTKLFVRSTGVRARVGSKKRYAEPVHQGARSHTFGPKRKKFLSFKWNKAKAYGIPLTKRGMVQFTKVRHPGMKGVPYLTFPLQVFGRANGFRVTVVRSVV